MMPLSMEATDGLSLGGELEASRENSSGSSSWQSTASSSFVAVIVAPSALRLERQRMRQSSVPCGKTSGPFAGRRERISHGFRNRPDGTALGSQPVRMPPWTGTFQAQLNQLRLLFLVI